ncbi:MAG: hypothetical protein NTV79_06555 [Candidatus Aureabacteria bacterium]|nr:hypothetical protein [Candidatus Auribacterota bacterium]
MKTMACLGVIALLMWTGVALAENKPTVAGCVSYETNSGSGSYNETFCCPDRFLPGHRTDHFVTEVASPPAPVQTQTFVTHEAPYYNVPVPPPAPQYYPRPGPYSYYPWPVWRYSYQTRNPWFWGGHRPYWACAR